MTRKHFKSYAYEIAKELGIEYEKVLKMKVEEIEEITKKTFESEISEIVMDEERNQKLRLLWPLYQEFYDRFGEDLIRTYAYYDENYLFEWNDISSSHIKDHKKYSSPEFEKYKRENNGYYNRTQYLTARDNSYFRHLMAEVVSTHYPELAEYFPVVSSSEVIGDDQSLEFHVIREFIQEGDADYEFHSFDGAIYNEKKPMGTFICSIHSFVAMDWDAMFEDCLHVYNFYKCEKGSARYNQVNNFMNSQEFAKFRQIIFSIIEKEKKKQKTSA